MKEAARLLVLELFREDKPGCRTLPYPARGLHGLRCAARSPASTLRRNRPRIRRPLHQQSRGVQVVADSSPLIVLAKIDCLELIPQLYGSVTISAEVHAEVVRVRAGLPGASQTARARWIEVREIRNPSDLSTAQARFRFGKGELSTIILAKELQADLILVDDFKARKRAAAESLTLRGAVGILEASFLKGYLPDLRQAYQRLLRERAYIDRQILDASLKALSLPPL